MDAPSLPPFDIILSALSAEVPSPIVIVPIVPWHPLPIPVP